MPTISLNADSGFDKHVTLVCYGRICKKSHYPMSDRYHTLDAMRGIAALAVVALHIGHVMRLDTLPHAYLAVDFFFMLSGFVLSRAYEARLGTSLSLFKFIEVRIVRLYPLFLLGVLFGAAKIVGQIIGQSSNAMSPAQASISFVLNAVMLPGTDDQGNLFPLNMPAWSLFLELVINLAFGLFLFRMKSWQLMLLTFASGVFYFLELMEVGRGGFGSHWDTIGLGFLRVLYAFPLGILFARTKAIGSRPSWASIAILGIFGGILSLSATALPAWAIDALGVFIAFPLLLWAGAMFELPSTFHRIGNFLGNISYPLYAVHMPLLQIVMFIFVTSLKLPAGPVATIFFLTLVGLSWLLAIKFDAPIRIWLSRMLALRRSAMPQP